MCEMRKMASIFAKEMIEHNFSCGATQLNLDYIADQACELAYKIDRKVEAYNLTHVPKAYKAVREKPDEVHYQSPE